MNLIPLRLAAVMAAALLAAGVLLAWGPVAGQEPGRADFGTQIRPLLQRYCFRCHGEKLQEAELRLDRLDPDMVSGPDAETWKRAQEMIQLGEMPRSTRQPTDAERRLILGWLGDSLAAAVRARQGERRVVLRRLNKEQYTWTLQELLGLPIDFGRVLPDDGKSKMGFTNNGAVLRASTLHLETYQAIARAALDQAIVVGRKPAPAHYRVAFGKGLGIGTVAGTTGGYQSVPLSTEDFLLEILDAQGRPQPGSDALRRRISIGLRGSAQDRFHPVEEGLILYGALPHKEVAPGSWQGPSPNVKLEMQRVFPQQGDFEFRVRASRGYLVQEKRELLVSLEDPVPRAALIPHARRAEPTATEQRAMQPTKFGPWFQAGPVPAATGQEARDAPLLDAGAPLDFRSPLADGEARWTEAGDTDGKVQLYRDEVGVLYLARVIEAPSARTLELSLGSDDALWVWLNGQQVLANDVNRGVAADQDRLALELRAGRNELLLKIVNYQGAFGSYHRVLYDGTRAGYSPFDLVAEDAEMVLRAERTDQRENLRFEGGALVPEDVPAPSSARLTVDFDQGGYYQFDLVHPATPPQVMGSIRFAIDSMRLDLRPELSAAEVADGHTVSAVGAAYLNAGRHEFVLGGPFFVGFSHLVVTPLPAEHPLVTRLEAEVEAVEFAEAPAIRAYAGTRTDDGMDYATFDRARVVTAPLGQAEVYTFRGRLENLPIPEPESGDLEILSGFLVLGLWNDHKVHSRKETGPPLLIEELEFEAPFHPVWPPASHTRIFFDSPLRNDEEAYARAVISRFAKRAFRSPLIDEEVERYLDFWRTVKDDYEHFEHGVREVLVALLCSPRFLFLANPEGAFPQQALAARLSYFLWNSPPDETLQALADKGVLRDLVEEQTDRLLTDPRSLRFVRAFAHEWLRLDRLRNMSVDVNLFPRFTRFVKADMEEETVQYLHHVIQEDLSLLTLVDSRFAMLNQNLAEFYGIQGVAGPDFRSVPLAPELGRGGLLAQGAFLTGHSDGSQPHPIKRAVWLKEKILGDPPMPPPPNVPDLDPGTPGFDQLTLKQQLELHRDKASCMDCHAGIDPYGVPFEGYNAVGLRQPKRKGRAVDASSVLPDGTEVDGVAALKSWLREQKRDQVAASVIEHLFAWALGRDLHFADEQELNAILAQVRAEDYRMRAVIRAIVTSPSFLQE